MCLRVEVDIEIMLFLLLERLVVPGGLRAGHGGLVRDRKGKGRGDGRVKAI
jgi:hypothetical protein